MNTEKDATTIGLTEDNHAMLKKFEKDGIFNEMKDCYLFAIAYSLNKEIKPQKISGHKKTIFNVGTLDPDNKIFNAIAALTPELDIPTYKYAERLAEAGMSELVKIYKINNRLDLSKIIEQSI